MPDYKKIDPEDDEYALTRELYNYRGGHRYKESDQQSEFSRLRLVKPKYH